MRQAIRTTLWLVLLLQVLVALTCVVSADAQLDGGTIRGAVQQCLATYQQVGLGNLAAGIGVATAVPLALLYVFRTKTVRR